MSSRLRSTRTRLRIATDRGGARDAEARGVVEHMSHTNVAADAMRTIEWLSAAGTTYVVPVYQTNDVHRLRRRKIDDGVHDRSFPE